MRRSCSCIVPYTRGKERSRDYRDIIAEVRDLAEKGYQEVTCLTKRQCLRQDFPDASYTFADLLSDLRQIAIPDSFRHRAPSDLDLRTIEVMATRGNIMPHIHLPVQSGSDRILKKMNRKYTREIYLELISQLRSHIPDIAITTDIIVGFPGETEEDFAQTLDLVRKADFEGAFTFIYSPRSGTPASKYVDDLPAVVKKQRLQELNKLVNEGYLKGNKRFEGKTVKVLVDGPSDKGAGMLAGYSEHDKLVNFPGDKSLIGKIIYEKSRKPTPGTCAV